ncbi:MAG: hypothetical protein KDD47_15465, partial [Acidobacteria bacterium]|nr:hypothetical protein [Acidobacteriota bacterium]
ELPSPPPTNLTLQLDEVATNLGVEVVVAFECEAARPPRKALLRLTDTGETRTLGGELQDVEPPAALLAVSRGWAEEVRSLLFPALPPVAESDLGFPASTAASSALAEALGAQQANDFRAAREALTRALNAETGAGALSGFLALLEERVGDLASAGEHARRCLELGGFGSRSRKLELQGLVALSEGKELPALSLLEERSAIVGEEIEGGLPRIRLLLQMGRSSAAREVLETLRRTGPTASGDPRLELAAAQIAALEEDGTAQLAAARRASEAAESRRAWTFKAAAALEEGEARFRQRDVAGSLEGIERAQDFYRRLRDRGGAARAEGAEGIVSAAVGDGPAAAASFDAALRILGELGLGGLEGRTLLQQARFLYTRGEKDRSLEALDRARARLVELGDRRGTLEACLVSSAIYHRAGYRQAADDLLQQAGRLGRELEDPLVAVRVLVRQGEMDASTGSPAPARERYEAALEGLEALPGALASEWTARRIRASAVLGLTEVLLAGAQLAEGCSLLAREEPSLRELGSEAISRRASKVRSACPEALNESTWGSPQP